MFEEFLLEGVKIDGEVYDDYVEESEIVTSALIMTIFSSVVFGGAALVGQTGKYRDRSKMKDVKNALSIYEKHCSPKVKLKDLTKQSYRLTGDNLDKYIVDDEMAAISNAMINIIDRGKLAYTTWVTDDGTIICGFGWPVDIKGRTLTKMMRVYVRDEYKKDKDYLIAAMSYNLGCIAAQNDKFVKDMKKYESVAESVMLEAMKYI